MATLAAVGGPLVASYTWIAYATDPSSAITLATDLDHAIPLEPAWILVYLGIYFQATAPLCVMADTRVLHRAVAAYGLVYLPAVPFWLWYPVTVPREPTPIVDLWTYGLALCRLLDPPTNCFPSMHVGLAFLAGLLVRRMDRPLGAVLLGTAAAITWSTLAVDQHWIVDGLAGLFLALVADHAAFGLRPLPPEALVPLPRRWHLVWLGAYAVVTAVLMSGWFWGWVPLDRLPPNVP